MINNIEEAILQYLDGTIDEPAREELLRLISQNPQNKALLDAHVKMRELLQEEKEPKPTPFYLQQSLADKIPILASRLPYVVEGGNVARNVATAARSGSAMWIAKFFTGKVTAWVLVGALASVAGYLLWNWPSNDQTATQLTPSVIEQPHYSASEQQDQGRQEKLNGSSAQSEKNTLTSKESKKSNVAAQGNSLSSTQSIGFARKSPTSSREELNTLTKNNDAKGSLIVSNHNTSKNSESTAHNELSKQNKAAKSSAEHESKKENPSDVNTKSDLATDQSRQASQIPNKDQEKPTAIVDSKNVGVEQKSTDLAKSDNTDLHQPTSENKKDTLSKGVESTDDVHTPLPVRYYEEEENTPSLLSYRVTLSPSYQIIASIGDQNNANILSFQPSVGLDYHLSDQVMLGVEIGNSVVSRISPAEPKRGRANDGSTADYVEIRSLVEKLRTLWSRAELRYKVAGSEQSAYFANLGGGFCLSDGLSPTVNVGFEGDYTLSNTLSLIVAPQFVGYWMQTVHSTATTVTNDGSTTLGVVHRESDQKQLLTPSFEVQIGISYRP